MSRNRRNSGQPRRPDIYNAPLGEDVVRRLQAAAAHNTTALSAPSYTPLSRGPQNSPYGMGSMPKGADPDTQKRPRLVEFGSAGVQITAGLITGEEYNTNLIGKQGLRVYDKMRRSDPIVRQGLILGDVPILAATKKVAPASPAPKHLEQASFIETALFHDLDGSFDEALRQILLYRAYGFFLMEKVFKIMDDGSVKWEKFAPRLPKTIYRWWEGPDRTLVGVQQWAWNTKEQNYIYVNIPAENLIRFTYQQEGNNYEGLSVLRSSYKPWFQKQAFEKLQAVGFEREHVGIPAITLPDGYSNEDVNRAAQIGRNARSNEVAYIILPPGWGVEWVKARGGEKKGASIADAIKYCDLQIQNNMLAGFMSLGQSGTGSYAASTDQSTLLLKMTQGDASYVAGQFNIDAIPQLTKFNFPDADMYARLVFQNVQAYNIKEVMRAIFEAVTSGAMRPSVELEDYIYSLIGIPTAPASIVESTVDGYGTQKRLPVDATGKTPLPLTPEEEIAIANRNTRDIQKITATKPGGTGSSSDKSDRSSVTTKTPSTPARGSKSGSTPMNERPNDIYVTHLAESTQRHMSAQQQRIYWRMAQEAGRPVITLRGDYEFASATTELREKNPAQIDRLNRRRAIVGDISEEIREGVQALRSEIKAEMTGALREYVDERVEDYLNDD